MINGNMCVLRDAKRGREGEKRRLSDLLVLSVCTATVVKREEGSQGANESLLGIAKRSQLHTHQQSGAKKMHLGQQTPLVDGLSLKELGDSVLVEIEPRRKGLSFLKHVEYRIVSKCFQIPVQRRYSDFEVFHGLLLQKFIYRTVPPLPPKRILKGVLNSVSDREFNDSRRRGLQRFMTLVIRHPVLAGDELVNIFLSASSADVQNKMRDAYKKTGDEFLTSQIALHGKVNLPEEMRSQAAANREVIANTPDLPPNATMSKAWKTQRKSLGELSGEFGLLADKAAHQGSREEDEVVEKLNLLLEQLQSYKDLCDRHDSGVLLEHQRTFEKRSGPVATHLKYQSSIEQPESRLTQMGDVWGELHPKLKDLFENTNEASSRPSSQTHTSRGQKTCAVIGPA
ncbi:Sorting nexin-8 [Anabarilius grahami]|uniref:Sorting nexin-8 n=1 Tax=Anabarilius grahami TaxID=495550 RepID=A0A3N0XF06_ANAGA|nr:Sorting nexin-8 [Anabarilius grahami]